MDMDGFDSMKSCTPIYIRDHLSLKNNLLLLASKVYCRPEIRLREGNVFTGVHLFKGGEKCR